ncbi:non-heme halogenase [Bisporella sp. PMI_857]|nr:non-heme halogenase [Bisporella sp. PMI_857]
MSIPTETTVLVVGGGPGGSYAASALAREGINVCLLEAEVFPSRYHVGESMVASIRHFLRFIDLDSTFNNHGFIKKTGAAFKLNNKREAYTDFIVAAGPDAYAWNVIRSESDHLIFKHAGKCGAKTFDGVKVTDIEFQPFSNSDAMMTNPDGARLGKPVSVSWLKKDGTTGNIKFDYLVDASGRAGIISTKYLKNRAFNHDLKNVASWGYFKGAIQYGVGTPQEGQPFFEAQHDGSGWTWFIPLHNGTVSVGVVMNQKMATDKKKAAAEKSPRDFYLESIQGSRGVAHLLENAELATEIKHASDWSYSASSYGSPYLRIVGDAGAFIDPYFSSGVHLALSSALSAAVTISASIRGDCDEETSWKWHSDQVRDRFTRFLLVVLSATKQIRHKDTPVMNSAGDDGFDDAFSIIRPIIQGTADVKAGIKREDISKAVEFTSSVVAKSNGTNGTNGHKADEKDQLQEVGKDAFTTDEERVLKMVKNVFKDFFAVDSYYGMVANLERGSLGLVKNMQDTMTEMKQPVAAGMPVAEVAARVN